MPRRVAAASILITIGLVACGGGSSSTTTSTTATAATTITAATTSTLAPASTIATTTIPLHATLPTVAPPTVSSVAPPTTAAASPTTAGGPSTVPRPGPLTPPTTGPVPEPSTAAAGPTSTQPPAAPCDAPTLLQAAEQAFGPLPAGTSASQPTCVENYASAILTAPGQDNAFVVFDNLEGEWEGVNLGTDQVCSGAGVPPQFFARLNCAPWG